MQNLSHVTIILIMVKKRKYWKITERENIVIIVPKFLNMVINCIHVFKLYINHKLLIGKLLIGY